MKLKTLTIPVVALLLVTTSFAQPRFHAGANFALGFPQGEFKENVENIGFGGFGQFAYNLPETPVYVGASIGFLVYGSDSRKEPFNANIPEVTVDVSTTNSILLGHLLLKLQPPQGKIRPYLNGLLGFNYLETSSSVESEGWDDDGDNEIASSNNFDDATFSYGVGAGLAIQVFEASWEDLQENEGLYGVFIEFGVNYIKGGEAEYLKKGSIQKDANNQLIFDVYQSKTDLLTAHIGVGFQF